MPKLSFIDSLLRRGKRSIPSDVLKAGHVLNVGEGEQIVLTYTSESDKMKIFSAFIREGLESGGAVWYSYPDEESETVRAKLKEHGVDVKKYEKNGALNIVSLTEDFMPNGKLDYDKVVIAGLEWWAEAMRKGYKHIRDIEDVGDFSFINGKW
jgi:KaiC/GvpD/RAD55 family RecA-like ATPase